MDLICAWCGSSFEQRKPMAGRFPVRLRISCSDYCSESIRSLFDNTRKLLFFVNRFEKIQKNKGCEITLIGQKTSRALIEINPGKPSMTNKLDEILKEA